MILKSIMREIKKIASKIWMAERQKLAKDLIERERKGKQKTTENVNIYPEFRKKPKYNYEEENFKNVSKEEPKIKIKINEVLQIKWKNSNEKKYDKQTFLTIFEKYGTINNVLINPLRSKSLIIFRYSDPVMK